MAVVHYACGVRGIFVVSWVETLLDSLPTKKNKASYKRVQQLERILIENPELCKDNSSDLEITDLDQKIMERALANHEKAFGSSEYRSPTQNVRLQSIGLCYRIECWLKRNWDTGESERLSIQDKIKILKEFGYDTN